MKLFFNFLLTLIFKIKSSYIKLPFRKFSTYQKEINYFNYLEKNDIAIIFEIGTPFQSIPIYINFELYSFYISGQNLNGKYNENSSSTLKKKQLSYFYSEVLNEGYESEDKFKLKDISNKEIIISDFNFIIPTKLNEHKIDNFIPSSLGLKIQDSPDIKNYGFLYILKQKEIIDSFGWTIKYLNNEEGEIIIGGYPHEYDKEYDISKFKNTKAEKRGAQVYWDLKFQYYLTDKQDFRNCHAQFDISFGFIKANFIYKNYLINEFFQFKNNCFIYNNTNYDYFICNSNEKISDFPKLILFHKDLNYSFEFNYKDLFIQKDNQLYFLIVFEKKSQSIEYWILGKPFFKKYQLVFESDRKLMGIYTEKEKKQLNVSWIIVFILFIILIILIIFIIQKYKNLPKKIKANELLEQIDSPFF